MKKISLAIIILMISLLLSSCTGFKLESSIDDLISPVSPSGEDASVQSAMDTYCKSGYSVKIPAGGKFTTSYIYYDFDGDKANEAIAFYEPGDNLGKIDMAVLEKSTDDGWSVVANLEGEGTDVYSVDFCDVNNDGKLEFLISWDVISNSTNHLLSIYAYDNSNKSDVKLSTLSDSISYSGYIPVDTNNDGVSELMVLSIDQSRSITANAELLSFKNNKKTLLSQTKIDGHVSSYKNLKVGQSDGKTCVFADAIKSDGQSMVTELIYWSTYYNSIISPFYSYATGITSDTTRKAMVDSCDINSDSVIEIPVDASIKDLPSGISAVDWKVYKSTVLQHSCYSVVSDKDNYQVIIPDKYFKNIKVKYDEENKTLSVYSKEKNEFVFSVTPVLKSRYEEKQNEYADFEKISTKSGYVYLAKVKNNSEIKITADDLKNMIKTF